MKNEDRFLIGSDQSIILSMLQEGTVSDLRLDNKWCEYDLG